MNIEQLKLIIEMLQGMGEGVKDITLLWLWLTFGGKVLEGLFVTGTLLGIAYVIQRTIKSAAGHDRCDTFLRDMRDKLGTGVGGYMSDSERDRTMAALRAMVDESRRSHEQ